MRLFNASVIPTLLYAAETLNIRTEDERRLDAFQNICIRKILHINWKQKKDKWVYQGCSKTTVHSRNASEATSKILWTSQWNGKEMTTKTRN